MNDEMLTIQQLAARSGLSVHTLRYYERAANGHRRYARADIERVGFLSRLRATGMSIRAMQEYTALARAGAPSLAARRGRLEAHRAAQRAQIAALQEHLAVIGAKIDRYQQQERAVGEPAAPPEQPCLPN